MEKESNFFINLSILFRNTQKFFDRTLAQYNIGSGQLIFLFSIYENEGITMQEVTKIAELDKGTTTKSIQKLIEQDYIQAVTDENDRRVKRLYTTAKASDMMNDLYKYRNECRNKLAIDTDFDAFESLLNKACCNSRILVPEERQYEGIKIGGLQKLTLLDYPGLLGTTIFTSGCNFKCPYCHNKDLVFVPENFSYFDVNNVIEFLKERNGKIDGVCITGGEPLLQEDLLDFVKEIKDIGYKVKLDTNGNYPSQLKEMIDSGYIDYIAMDIKNSPSKYHETVGLNKDVFDISRIEESIDLIKNSSIDYEFRTTLIKEFHEKEDLVEIGKWLKDVKHYYLQQYVESDSVIQKGWHAYNSEEMNELLEAVKPYIPNTKLRGVKEA